MLAALVRFSVRHPGVVVALALVVAIFGVLRMSDASLDVFPEFSPTQVVVQTEAPGLSAGLVETLVTQPVENALAGTSGLASMRSQSIPGLSVVTVAFADGSDIYRNRVLKRGKGSEVWGWGTAYGKPEAKPATPPGGKS